jgi:hypothetical protein
MDAICPDLMRHIIMPYLYDLDKADHKEKMQSTFEIIKRLKVSRWMYRKKRWPSDDWTDDYEEYHDIPGNKITEKSQWWHQKCRSDPNRGDEPILLCEITHVSKIRLLPAYDPESESKQLTWNYNHADPYMRKVTETRHHYVCL